jgi:hypothetical protein
MRPLQPEVQLLAALVRRALTRQPMFTRLAEAEAAVEAAATVCVVDPAAQRRLATALLRAIADAAGRELRQRRTEARERLNDVRDARGANHDDK